MICDVQFTRLRPEAAQPARATQGAAGSDLRACLDQPLTVNPGARVLVPTGLAIALPEDTAGFVFARSGLAVKQGLALANGVGVVDSDYRGELLVPLINLSDAPQIIEHGDRVAQLCVMPVCPAVFTEANELPTTARGPNGFGSTGVS